MKLTIKTRTRTELVDITAQVADAIDQSGLESGFCHLYVPHTTAAVTINEHADPDVRKDIVAALNHMVPENLGYRHREGNSPAHVKTSLVGASEWIAIEKGRPVLGTWQGIFFCEFDGPRTRQLQIRLIPPSL